MALWRFMDYCTEDGRNLIQEWYAAQAEAVKAAFDATLFILAATEDWTVKKFDGFKILTERHVGLGEIRFDLMLNRKKRKFRPVGIWPPSGRDFMILLGCEKSGRIYTPLNAFDLALEYKAQFEQGRGTICEHA